MQQATSQRRETSYREALLCGTVLATLVATDLAVPLTIPLAGLYMAALALIAYVGLGHHLYSVAALATLVSGVDALLHPTAFATADGRLNTAITVIAVWGSAAALRYFLGIHKSNSAELIASEEKYRALFEHAPVVIITVEADGRITSCNDNAAAIFGYDKADMLAMEVESLIPETVRERHTRYRRGYAEQPVARPMGEGGELYGRRRDGSVFPVSISLYPIRTASGTVTVAHIADITERRKAEETFRALLESAPDAMVIVNEIGEIQLANRQTQTLFGYSANELSGRKVEVLMPERFRERHTGHRVDYFLAPNPRPMGEGLELYGQSRDGTEFPVEISLSPLETADGLLISAAIRDISERRKNEQAIASYTEQLEATNRELEQFAYAISHDLREPLRTVRNFVDLLNEDVVTQEGDSAELYMNHIAASTERMSELVQGLLEYSRIGRTTERVEVNCGDIIEEVLADIGSAISHADAEIEVGDLPVVESYPAELRRLFQNLISNAIKFRKPDQPARVAIDAHPRETHWLFTVSDNGIGIEPEHRETVFMIFQRLHDEQQYEGSGIGLAQCRKIVQALEGDIWLESTPGEGTTFFFTLRNVAAETPNSA